MTIAGQRIGFERELLDELALAGLLLDIGKISVPITILAKPARLTGPERALHHPACAARAVHGACR